MPRRHRHGGQVLSCAPAMISGGAIWLNHAASDFALRVLDEVGYVHRSSIIAALCCIGRDAERMAEHNSSMLRMAEAGQEEDSPRGEPDLDDVCEEVYGAYKKMSSRNKSRFSASLKESLKDHIDYFKTAAAESDIGRKFNEISDLLGFSAPEKELIRLLLSKEHDDRLCACLEDDLEVFSVVNRPLLAEILRVSAPQLAGALGGRLKSMGFLESDYDHRPSLENVFYKILDFPENLEDLGSFSPAQKPRLLETDFFADKETVEMMKNLLKFNSPAPTHILLHGPAGVGKTEFARTIAASLGMRVYEVKSEEDADSHRRNLIIADAFVRREKGAVLIADEADELLTEADIFSLLFGLKSKSSGNSKSWIDSFMEQEGSKCVWIVNNPAFLSDTVIRRFSFSLAFPRLGRREREQVWKTARANFADIGSQMLSDPSISRLAAEADISPGVIAQTLRKSLEAGPGDEERLLSYVGMQIAAHQRLSGKRQGIPAPADNYRLDCVNSSIPAGQILSTLEEYDAFRKKASGKARDGIKLLFHGLPGTGKTELAHYLASSLGIELVCGRLSDILSPYVGEAENRLASLFDRAETLGGILVFDEVESLLSARGAKMQHHTLMLVNEFLLCLERFKSIFIGSTNMLESMDPAAVRRFTFKVEFKTLLPEARVRMFEAFLLPFSGAALSEAEKKHLLSIPALTPGDFSVVAARARWMKGEGAENISLLESLAQEASYRQAGAAPGGAAGGAGAETPAGSAGRPSSVN